MAKFCAECGAPLDEGMRFCGECGAPTESAPVIEQAPARQEAAELPQDGYVYAQPAQGGGTAVAAREKMPLPKWFKPAALAAGAVVVALAALALGLKAANAPEKTVEKFLDAAKAGDPAALSKLVCVDDETFALTQESLEPLALLCKENRDFYRELESSLEEDAERLEDGKKARGGGVATLVAQKAFLHTAYRVELSLCDAEVYSDLGGVSATVGAQSLTMPASNDAFFQDDEYTVYDPAYQNIAGTYASVNGLLPGRYALEGSYDTGYGHTLTGTGTLDVAAPGGNSAELAFACIAPDVYNDGDVEIAVYIGGTQYFKIPAGADGYLGPMSPDTQLELRADVGKDEPMSQTYPASDGYIYAAFKLCGVEFYNDTDLTIEIYQGDELLETIPAWDSYEVRGMPSGTKLQLRLPGGGAVYTNYDYTCEYENDYITPDFKLTDKAQADMEKAAAAYTAKAIEIYNQTDIAGLEALEDSNLKEYLIRTLKGFLEDAPEEKPLYENVELELDGLHTPEEKDGALILPVVYDMEYDFSWNGLSDDYSMFMDFVLQYQDGSWTVVG